MKRNLLLVLVTSLIILLITQPLITAATEAPPGTGIPPGTEERLLEAEAVANFSSTLYFDKSGNRVDDWTQSYYGVTYKFKYVLTFWNVGALGWSKDKKYADAEMKAVFSPDGYAFATNEEKMYKEANAPWEGKHFDEYKNDPAWVEANKKLADEIEAIKKKELTNIEEPVETLYFTGGAWGQFKKAETFELVGKIEQLPDTSHVIKFPKGYDYTEFADKFGITGGVFPEFRITSKQPFIEWEGYFEGGYIVKEQVLGSISISDMSGDVEIQQPGEDSWDFANLGVVGFQTDGGTIRTGAESYVLISFADMSSMVLGPESEVTFIKSDPTESKLKLVYGNLMANIKRMIKDDELYVEMNQAVLGIKGTVFVCEENGEESTLKVLEGTVEFTDKNGRIAIVTAGEKISADSYGMKPVDEFNVQQEQETWDSLQKKENAQSGSILVIVFAIVLIAGFAIFFVFKKRTSKDRPS